MTNKTIRDELFEAVEIIGLKEGYGASCIAWMDDLWRVCNATRSGLFPFKQPDLER